MVSGVDPEALRAARVRAGLTQHELARLVGVAGGERISRWELGTSEPRPELLSRLARILDLSPRDLLRTDSDGPDLRGLRLGAGLSARDLCERAHLSRPTYLRWEAGRWERLPAGATLAVMAGVLAVRVADVVAGFDRARTTRRCPPGS